MEGRLDLLDDPELANAYADAALLAGRLDDAVHVMEGGLLEPVLAARICLARGDAAAALNLLGDVPPRATARSHFYGTKLRAFLALSQMDAAKAAANDWIAADRSTPQPYLLLARALAETDPVTAEGYYEQALQRGDDQPPVIIECADHFARTGRVAAAQDLVRGLEPVQPYFRRRREQILSLIASA
jgi:hypothetical protein